MSNMADGNTASLRAYESEQARGGQVMDEAQAERAQLVAEYIQDEKNERELRDYLGDLAGGGSEILSQIQRIGRARKLRDDIDREAVIQAALRIAKAFTDCIDHAYGDELVEKRAEEIEERVPCRCKGPVCYC